MSEIVTEPHIVAATTIFVQRTIKLGSAAEADESREGDTEVIEVHKFATQPGEAHASLTIRKSQQTANGDWVAGELTISCRRACYNEELDAGSDAAYAHVKEKFGVHLPKMLTALDQLSGRK